jgi:Flp pilus assembly protein TadD
MRLLLAALLAFFSGFPASAQWFEAETDHFIVLSESSERAAGEMAVKLERFDEALRFLQGMGVEEVQLPRSSKLTVFHFGSQEDIARLASGRSSSIAGFFIPRAGRSVAFVPRRSESISRSSTSINRSDEFTSIDPEIVLFHEYAHYFMFQHRPAAYPAWYREGSAEVYGTLQLTDDGFRLGEPALHRSMTLEYFSAYSVKQLLDPPEELESEDGMQLYALGWLLAHYLTFSDERPGQLGAYLTLINQGRSSIDAGREAFGDLDALNRELNRYGIGRLPVIDVRHDGYEPPKATVRRLGPDEDARMELYIQASRGVDQAKAKSLIPTARALEVRFPESVPVLLSVVEAEFDAENDSRAEEVAGRIVALDPDNAAAQLYLGHIAMRRGKQDPAEFGKARRAYAAAARLDANNPVALSGYYQSFVGASQNPPEDARIALEQAYEAARFDAGIRIDLAHLYLVEERGDDAIALLAPLVNDPHAGKSAEKLRNAIEQIEAGSANEAIDALRSFGDDEESAEGSDLSAALGAMLLPL